MTIYEVSHIPHSAVMSAATLNGFQPGKDQSVWDFTDPETHEETTVFKKRAEAEAYAQYVLPLDITGQVTLEEKALIKSRDINTEPDTWETRSTYYLYSDGWVQA